MSDLIIAVPGSTGGIVLVEGIPGPAGGVASVAAVSPLTVSSSGGVSTISLTTVPVTLGGTGLTAAGAVGTLLGVVSAGVLGYGAVNLANASSVTGLLPIANIAPSGTNGWVLTTTGGVATWAAASGGITALTGDVTAAGTGSVAATVGRINGATVPAAGALVPGNTLQVTGASTLAYGAIPLGGGSTVVTGVLPIANLGTGSAGQILQANATPANAFVTVSQDATIAVGGAVTVTQAQAGLYAFPTGTGLVTLAAAATAPGLLQATQTTDTAPPTLTITAGAALASATTNLTGAKLVLSDGAGATTNGVNGGIDLALQGQTFASSVLAHPLRFTSGGTPFFVASPYTSNASSFTAMWWGPTATAPTASNANVLATTGSIQINASGSLQFENNGFNRFQVDTTGSYGNTSTNVGVNGSPAVGGGSGVLAIKNATTQPSTAISGGIVLASSAGTLAVYDASGLNAIVSGSALTFSGGAASKVSITSTAVAGAAGNSLTIAAQNSTGTGATTGGSLLINYGTGATEGQILMGASANAHQALAITDVSGTYIVLVGGLLGGGDSITQAPLQFYSSSIGLGTSGTTTVSALQSQTPRLVLSSGTLTGSVTLDFSTNGTSGFWIADTSGVGIGATFGLIIKNGTKSVTILSTSLPTGGLLIISTGGANTLAVN